MFEVSVHGQVGWGSEQPDLVKDGPAAGGQVDQMISEAPFQPAPLRDSVICHVIPLEDVLYVVLVIPGEKGKDLVNVSKPH